MARQFSIGTFGENGSSKIVEEDTRHHNALLLEKASEVCRVEGIDYSKLEALQKKFLTHYRCPMCKMMPLYYLDIKHHTRVRCKKCGNIVSFTNAGKYGKIRKKIAALLIPQLEMFIARGDGNRSYDSSPYTAVGLAYLSIKNGGFGNGGIESTGGEA